MSKFYVRFCNCGTVHFIPWNLFNGVFYKDDKPKEKGLIHVCARCGMALTRHIQNHGSSKPVTEDEYYTLISDGVRIMMQSGNYADGRIGNAYVDREGLRKELDNLGLAKTKGAPCEERADRTFRDFKSTCVDMETLLQNITTEQAISLCEYEDKSFDWTGTPYEEQATNSFSQ